MLAPETEEQVAEAVANATGPLALRGGGTRTASVAGEVLSLAAVSGVTLYEPGALTIVAKAGTPVAEVEATLADAGQRLPFEPMDHRALMGREGVPTIGGVVAMGVAGPRRVQAGACRDSLIGVRFVDGTGTVIKNGGRVMKNVTGYDLVKLMAGSHGTLGALTEVAFKVLPAPEAVATLVFDGLGWTESAAVFAKALGTPFEVNGAARLPAGSLGPQSTVLLRVEGFADQVAYRVKALSQALSDLVVPDRVVRDSEKNAALWAAVRDVTPLADRAGDIWRISVKPTDVTKIAAVVGQEETVLDWGGGLVWACVPEGTDVRAGLEGTPGHATMVRASAETRRRLGTFQPEPAPLAALSAGLRAKFDPRGILNAGLMG